MPTLSGDRARHSAPSLRADFSRLPRANASATAPGRLAGATGRPTSTEVAAPMRRLREMAYPLGHISGLHLHALEA
jgi:hypothetical protein